MLLSNFFRAAARAFVAHGTLFSYLLALFAPAFAQAGAGNRYSASLCARHAADPVAEAKPVLGKTKPGCTKVQEETKFLEGFFAGSDGKEAFGKRTEALIKEAHANVQAYVDAAKGDVNQTTAGADVQALLTKMRASRTKLEELMKELGAIYERIRKDKVEVVPFEAVGTKSLNDLKKTQQEITDKYNLAKASVAKLTEVQSKATQEIANAKAQNGSARMAEMNLQQATSSITALQTNQKTWTTDLERLGKAAEQIRNATTDIIQDHRALDLAGTDWNKEAQRIKVAQYRITFADPGTAANDKENARKGLVDIQKSSVITAAGASQATGAPGVPGAPVTPTTTADQARLAQLTKGTEAGDVYLDTHAMLEKALAEGKKPAESFGTGDVVEQTLNASQDSAMKGVRKDTEYFLDDASRAAAHDHLTSTLDKVSGPLADIYGAPAQVKKPEADAGLMSKMITQYEPADGSREKVNAAYERYNAEVAKLTPEEREYWRNEMKMPLQMSDKELYYSSTMAAHRDGSNGGYMSGALDFGKGLWTGASNTVSGTPTSVQDPGWTTVARNRIPGSEAAFQEQLGDQLVNSIQEKTYRATGNADTMSSPQYFRNVVLPDAMAKATPDWAKEYGFGEGSGNLEDHRKNYITARDNAQALAAQANDTPIVVPGHGVTTTADMAAEATAKAHHLGFTALESNSPYMAQVLASNPELTRQAVDLSTTQATALHGDSAWSVSQTKHMAGEFVAGVTGPWGQESLAQSSQNKAVMLTAAAQEFHTNTLENAAAKAREAAQTNRDMTFVAGAMTLTGQTVISGAVMKAGKAAYMEGSSMAMIAREAAVVTRVADAGVHVTEAAREVARPIEAFPRAVEALPRPSPEPTLFRPREMPESVVSRTATISEDAARSAPLAERPVNSAAAVARSAEAPFVSAVEHSVPAAERIAAVTERVAPAAERFVAPAERVGSVSEAGAHAVQGAATAERGIASVAETGHAIAGVSRPSSESVHEAIQGASHIPGGARSASEAASQGASRIASAISESVSGAQKVAEPAATVRSSGFLARVAESVGWSGQRVATVAAGASSTAGSVLRQGERGVQELEHLAGAVPAAERAGGVATQAARVSSEGASAVRPAEQAAALVGTHSEEAKSAAGAAGESAKAVKTAEATKSAEEAVSGASGAEKAVHVAGTTAEAARSSEKAVQGGVEAAEGAQSIAKSGKIAEETGRATENALKNSDRAEKQVAAAAKDEKLAAKEGITPKTFAAEAEKMLKPGSKTDRYLDHITNLSAIKAVALKDPAYLARLAKEEGTSTATYLSKLDRRINYFEKQLHEKFAFPKTYMEQFKEAALHGGLKPEEISDIKRLLTQRAVLESSVAKSMVTTASRKVEAAMKAALEGGDRAALEAALKKAAVPEYLAKRVADAMEAAKTADRLTDPVLRAAMPAIARDLAGAAVLTKKAPQVGKDLFENVSMAFNPRNKMVVGLAGGAIQKYISSPFVRTGRWIMERPDWFRGVPKYAVKDFTEMELEARLATAALSSGERLTADVRRMARVATEAEEASSEAKQSLAREELAAKLEQAKREADLPPGAACAIGQEINCSEKFTGMVPTGAMVTPVQQLGKEDKLWEMARNPAKFSREEYFKEASKVVSVNSYVESQGLRGYPVFAKVNAALEKLGPEYRALFLDPGTIVHGDELADFVAKSKTTWKDPWELRRAFSEELGTEKVYRGVVLTPDLVEKVKVEGMSPAYMRDPRFQGFVRSMGTSTEAMAKTHIGGSTSDSMFQSVTFYKDLAVSVSQRSLKNAPEGSAVYVVEMDLPKLDLFHYNASGYPASPSYAKLYHEVSGVTRDGKPFSALPGGPGLESLVYLPISPDSIKTVEKVSDAARYDYVAPDAMALAKDSWKDLPGPGMAEYLGNKITDSDVAKLQAVTPLAGAGDLVGVTQKAPKPWYFFDMAEKIRGPGADAAALASEAEKAPRAAAPAGSLLAKSQDLGVKMESTVRDLLESGREVDPVRRQLKIETAVRTLVTEDKIPPAEVERLRDMVNGGKVPTFTAKDLAEQSASLAQARFLADSAVAPKVASLDRSLAAAFKSGDVTVLRSLGVDQQRAEKLLGVEKMQPGLLAKQGATRNLAESILLARDAGEALAKNRLLNTSERMRRFAAGSAQLSAALVVGSARGLWSGAKWAASFTDRDSALGYWARKTAGFTLDSGKDLGQVRWTTKSLAEMNKLGRAEEAQGAAYWLLVGAGEKTDAASRVAREAALSTLRDSGLSEEAVGMVRAEALLHVDEPLALAPVIAVGSLEDVGRKRDLGAAAGGVFTRTAGLTDPTSAAARSAAEKALLNSGWSREEVNNLISEAKAARAGRDSEAKSAVRELIDLAQVPHGLADHQVEAVVESLRASGHSEAAINGVRQWIERDSEALRGMLRGSPRDSGDVIAATLKGTTKDYEALLMPSRFQTAEQEHAAVAKLFERLEREPGIDHGARAGVAEKLKRLEDKGVSVSTNGVRDAEGNLVREAEGGVNRGADGRIRLQTYAGATEKGQLTSEAMLAHESVHVRSLQMSERIEGLEGSLATATGVERDVVARQLSEASGRSVFLKSVDGASVIPGSAYEKGFALDEVQAHIEGARKEAALARMYLTQNSGREGALRASAGLNFARESLKDADEFSGTGQVHLSAARDLVSASPKELAYDPTTGIARVEVASGTGKVAVEMNVARGLTPETAAARFTAAADFTAKDLSKGAERSRGYLAQETARLQNRVANGDFGKLGGGAYANAKPTYVRGTEMLSSRALKNADPVVREASLLRDAREAVASDQRRASLTRNLTPSERLHLLTQEEDYLARRLAVSKDELRALNNLAAEQRVADLERAHAGVTAQMFGAHLAREREIADAGGARNAGRAFVNSMNGDLLSRYADRFPGKTLDEVLNDSAQAALFKALHERDVVIDAKNAREARETFVQSIAKRVSGADDPTRAEKMASEIVEAQAAAAAARDAAGRDAALTDSLIKKGWSFDQVDTCLTEGLCGPKLETRAAEAVSAEVSPMAREILAREALARAAPKTADEARSIAHVAEGEPKLAELQQQKAALLKESEAKTAALATKPADAALTTAVADVKRAEAAVDSRIAKINSAEEAARSLLKPEDVKLEKLGQSAAEDFLRSVLGSGPGAGKDRLEKLAQIDSRLASDDVVKAYGAGRWGPGNATAEFKKVVATLPTSKQAELFDLVKGTIGNAAEKPRGFSIPGVPNFTAPVATVAKAVEDPAKVKAAAEAVEAAAKAALAEQKRVEAQTRALVAAETRVASRKPASLAVTPVNKVAGEELAKIPGLDAKARAALAESMAGIEADGETAFARTERMRALSSNPDLFESYRMAYNGASATFRDASAKGQKITREQAWESGLRKMLHDSGYSDGEIDGGLLHKTEVCLTM